MSKTEAGISTYHNKTKAELLARKNNATDSELVSGNFITQYAFVENRAFGQYIYHIATVRDILDVLKDKSAEPFSQCCCLHALQRRFDGAYEPPPCTLL